jgi:hypothetical protein
LNLRLRPVSGAGQCTRKTKGRDKQGTSTKWDYQNFVCGAIVEPLEADYVTDLSPEELPPRLIG